MPIRDCFTKYKISNEKLTEFDRLVNSGINEYQAARQIVLSEHESLHNRMNDIRKLLKGKTIPYAKKEDISGEVKKIEDKYAEPVVEKPSPEAIANFGDRIASGEKMTSEMDLQFYDKEEIEKYLKGKATNETTGKQPAPEPSPVPDPKPDLIIDGIAGDLIGISHAETNKVAQEFGLPEYEKDEKQTIEELDNKADEMLRNGYNVEALLGRYRRGSFPSAVEQRIMLRYIAHLKQIANNDPSDENLVNLKEAKQLSDITGGREIARSLRARQGLRPVETMTYADWLVDEMEDLGIDELLDVQKQMVKEEYDAIVETTKSLQDKVNELTIENAKLRAKKNIKEAAGDKSSDRSKDLVTRIKERGGRPLKDIKGRGEEIANLLRKGKIKINAAQLNIAGIPIAIYNTVIDAIALSVEGGASLTQAINDAIVKYKLRSEDDFDRNALVKHLEEITGESFIDLTGETDMVSIAPDVIKLARDYVSKDVTDLDKIVDGIHGLISDQVDVSKNDIIHIIAGDYNKKKPLRSEVTAKMRDLTDEAKLVVKYESLLNEVVPKNDIKKHNERSRKLMKLRELIKNHDLTKLAESKKNIQSQIKKLGNQLAKGDFRKAEKSEVELDEEGKELKTKLMELRKKRDVRRIKNQLDKRSAWKKKMDKLAEWLNVPRSMMASTDFSAPFNQGLVATIGYPKEAKEAAAAMFKAAFNQKYFEQYFEEVRSSPTYDLMVETGLGMADPNSPNLLAREEAFMSGIAERLPFVKASERAYVMYLNKLRIDLFNKFIEEYQEKGKTYDNSKELYDKTAKYINNITGRGDLGKLEQFAPIFNSILFSPRLIASRLQLLNPVYGFTLPEGLRKRYYKDMGKTMALGNAILGLAYIYGKYVDDDEDEENRISVEYDPRSSDFAKIKQGNTRWNIWGGFQPYIRVFSQFFTEQRKSTTSGVIRDLDGKGPFSQTRGDVVLSFARGKLAPIPSFIVDMTSGQNAIGEDFVLWKAALTRLVPLSLQSTFESVTEDGPSAFLTTMVPAVFGIGVDVYQPKRKEMPAEFDYGGKKIKLSDEDVKKYSAIINDEYEETMKKARSSDVYKSLSPDEKLAVAQAVGKKTVAQVKKRMFLDKPELRLGPPGDTDEPKTYDSEQINKIVDEIIRN